MKQIIVLAILIPMILGCENSSVDISDNSDHDTSDTLFIIAGIVTNKDTVINLSSEIDLFNRCGFETYTDIDSIDILNDGQFDIVFTNKRWGFPEDTDLCPQVFSIDLLSNVQVGYKERQGNALLPLYLSDTINQDLIWTANNVEILFDSDQLYGRDWFMTPEAYLPFRSFDNTDTLYGWIELIKLVKIKKYGINKGYQYQ